MLSEVMTVCTTAPCGQASGWRDTLPDGWPPAVANADASAKVAAAQMAAAKCLRLSFGAPSSRTAATPTVQVERLQPSQIIVEGPSRRIIPGGPGRYQWFTLMHSVLRNSRASCVAMSSEQPDACSRYDHPDEARSSLLRKLLKASEHCRRVAGIAACGAGYPATDELTEPESGHFNLAATIKSGDHTHYVNSNAIDESRDRNARKRKYRR